MNCFNYKASVEFYSRRSSGKKANSLTFQRFNTAAEAIRFAMEDLPSAAFGGCMLEADGERFGAKELKELYASPRYPFPRNPC
jgi:hypothetical protein